MTLDRSCRGQRACSWIWGAREHDGRGCAETPREFGGLLQVLDSTSQVTHRPSPLRAGDQRFRSCRLGDLPFPYKTTPARDRNVWLRYPPCRLSRRGNHLALLQASDELGQQGKLLPQRAEFRRLRIDPLHQSLILHLELVDLFLQRC